MTKVKRLILRAMVVVNALYLAHRSGRAVLWMLDQDELAGATYRNFSFRNTSDGPLHDGFGIAYSGASGLALAAGQVGVLLVGLVLFFVASRGLRRVGWATLVGMSILWVGNLIYMCVLTGVEILWALLALHVVGLVATAVAFPRSADRTTADTGGE